MSSANVSSSPAGHSPASLPPASASSATDDNRPRGGTARTPGTRTPRRVQWAPAVDDDEGQRFRDRQRSGSRTDSVDVPHLLDEAGLDPAAFETLADALEKHRSTSASPSPFPSAPPPTANLSKPPTISFPPSSFPHFPNTLSQAPPLREKDYFHPHPETPPTEPSSPPTFRSNRLSLPAELPREHDFPGEIFVDPNETAGLPVPKLTEDEDETDGMDEDTSAAKAIVHAHTRKSRLMASLPKLRLPTPPHARSKPSPPSASKSAPNMSRSRPRDRDVEHAAAHARSQLPAGLGAGGGILSALLALYDHQDDDPQSAASSRNPSPRRRGRGGRSRSSERRGGITPSGSPESGRGLSSALGRAFSGWKDARPAKERSAAGVWGPLIASTANISGAAAPVNSTIVPNIKRPGYHLSRYSLDEDLPRKKPSLARTRSANSDTLSPSATPGGLHLDLSSLPSPHLNLTMPHFPGREHTPEEASSTPASLARAPSPATSDASHFPFHAHSRSVSAADTLTPGGGGGGGAVYRAKWSEVLKDLPKRGWNGLSSLPGTPGTLGTLGTETATEEDWDEKDIRRWEKNDRDEKRRARQKRRKKAEIFITRHISSLIARQTFILKLARAMMMFGGPTHRLQAQLQSTARVLEISLSCMYLPDTMLVSFDDDITSTSSVKLIKQGSSLDLAKLQEAYKLYWKVIHDDISVQDASSALDALMRNKPTYSPLQLIFFGGMASASICSVSFKGSFVDCLVSFPLGAFLVTVQLLSVKNELYSNVFEITITTLLSFISAALAQTRYFCYSAVASSSVVLILPGFLVLCGSLELSSRNMVSGAVRLCYALVYSLFLGFGLAIGAEVYEKITHHSVVGPEDNACALNHDPDVWWQSTPSLWWAFLSVPMFSLFLSLRNQAPWNRKEIVLLVVISCIGWVTNHYASLVFPNQSDISSAVGAFAVGFVANVYGRVFKGNAFVVMITGILFQVPSGLSNGGLFTFAEQSTSGQTNSYLSGFQTALQLVSVSLGLTVGLGISLVLVFPIQSRKRQAGVFSL